MTRPRQWVREGGWHTRALRPPPVGIIPEALRERNLPVMTQPTNEQHDPNDYIGLAKDSATDNPADARFYGQSASPAGLVDALGYDPAIQGTYKQADPIEVNADGTYPESVAAATQASADSNAGVAETEATVEANNADTSAEQEDTPPA